MNKHDESKTTKLDLDRELPFSVWDLYKWLWSSRLYRFILPFEDDDGED